MAIIGIVLGVFGIGIFFWLLFTLAVYALPFFAGLTAALAAFHAGSGVIGAFIVGVLAGVATLAIGRVAVAGARTPLPRILIALVYAIPATVAGYQLSFGLSGIGMPLELGNRSSLPAVLFLLGLRPSRAWRLSRWRRRGALQGTTPISQPSPCGHPTSEGDLPRRPRYRTGRRKSVR
jgi:hypothetical protein